MALIKSDSKEKDNVTKLYLKANYVPLNLLFIKESRFFFFYKKAAQLFSTNSALPSDE